MSAPPCPRASLPSRPRASIQRRLLWSMIAVLVTGIAVSGGIVYRQARDEANELFDLQLRQIAQSIPVALIGATPPGALEGLESGQNVVVRIWDRTGAFVYGTHAAIVLPRPVQLGLTTVTTAQGDWRLFAAIVDGSLLEVAQPVSVRSRLAAEVALRTVLPLLVLLPILALVLWWVVGRGLAPLRRVANDVGRRRPEALGRLSEDALPEEVAPLVASLNRLLDDLAAARDAQRAFIADAAHELRTPLTAVQLQLQIVERAEGQEDARAAREAAIDALRAGLRRATRLVEQLLALARAEPEIVVQSTSGASAAVDLVALATDAVAMHASLAHDRGIDLGIAPRADVPLTIAGDRDALFTLLGNLIDNALRYTPRGGRVDVGVARRSDAIVVSVVDDGPGIAPDDRERVFDRFHRGEAARAAGDTRGSGLGLAIVRRIAERHGAQVTLATPAGGHGLAVELTFAQSSSAGESPRRQRGGSPVFQQTTVSPADSAPT